MSITYEQALETLESMFGAPWTRESLDAVLRHHKGHMENTVESILKHGDQDPAILVSQLKAGVDPTTQLDQELARQLAREEQQRIGPTSNKRAGDEEPSGSYSGRRKGRGTPTELPPDFLRIPGSKGTSTSASTLDQDEALARMLQDELFSQELANNPEFAHLARGRRAAGSQRRNTSSAAGGPRATVDEGPNIVEKITEMGHAAKLRLQMLAAQWNAGNRFGLHGGTQNSEAAGTPASNPVAGSHETRGLLDSDDDGEEMELTFASPAGKKSL